MSQYNSRIFIKVKNAIDWNKLSDVDFSACGFDSNPFIDQDTDTFIIDGDWSCFEDELEDLAQKVVSNIPDCLLLADTSDINVDPFAFIVYNLGNGYDCDNIDTDLQWESDISEPFDWFATAGINLKDSQKEFLHSFGFVE